MIAGPDVIMAPGLGKWGGQACGLSQDSCGALDAALRGGIKLRPSREGTKALDMKIEVQGQAWGRASSAGQRVGAHGH